MEAIGKSDKESRWQNIRNHVVFQIFFFLLVTFLEFVFLELFWGISVFQYEASVVLKNVLLFAAINLFLVGVFHSVRLPLLLSVGFFTLAGIANYFVTAFRGYGIVFMDLYAVKTAAQVAGGYSYKISWNFILAFLLDMALFGACFLLPGRRHAYRHVKYMFVSLLGMAVSAFFFFWISSDTVFFKDVSGLTWDHSIGMKEYGYVLYFASNAGRATVSEPAGYSAEKADSILSDYEETEEKAAKDSGQTLPNLIMIMNESFSDLSVLGSIQTSQEVMPFYNSLTKNVIKGYAVSSVYGGYTANSEFEFLTGCTKAFLPGSPYLQYIDDYMPSLITRLKEQGYGETVAVHPYHASGYNRNRVYPLLGFDCFLSLDDFSQTNLVRDYVGDLEDYQKIEALYEQKEEGTPLCVFNVTMQNHNPYDNTEYVFENPVELKNFTANASSVNQYLSLMKLSDEALEQLVTYFEQVDEPVMIVLFGDHQPHLPDAFYRFAMGNLPSLFSQEQVMTEHLVPFMIWANYDIEEQEMDKISLNYLSSMVLEKAGLQLSDYDRYLLALQKKLPSISASGYYDAKGVLYDYEDSDTPYQELLEQYKIVQYNYLFDKKNRLDNHFAVSSNAS